MKILVLEDDGARARFFIEKMGKYDLIITENANKAIEHLKSNDFDYIFLDNDLGEDNGYGADVAAYLYNNPDNFNFTTNVYIHSWNVPAAQSMLDILPNAIFAPYGSYEFIDYVVYSFMD